jgi:DNA topoisomerase-1
MTIVAQLQTHGIRRQGTKRSGFRYARPGRRRIGAHDRARIASLRLPPAWTRVAISSSPSARVQAVGRDAAGRWQYVYHAHHVRRRAQSKFERMLVFGRALPKMRRAVARDLSQPGLDRNYRPRLHCSHPLDLVPPSG